MTLIVAAACRGGVVVAADSQITAGDVRFASEKLRRMGERVIWGSSGSLGTTQLIEQELAKHFAAGADGVPIEDLRHRVLEVVNPVQRAASARWPGLPRSNPPASALLFAGHTAGRSWILQIAENGESFVHNPRDEETYANFAAIGSGGAFAYLAQASLAHYDLPNTEMDLARALIYRAMLDIIRTSAHGVGFPISMGLVTRGGVRLLDEQERRLADRDANYIGELEAEVVRSVFGDSTTGTVSREPSAPE